MDRSVYMTAAGMNASLKRLRRISVNMANSSTPGFKRTVGRVLGKPDSSTSPLSGGLRPVSAPESLDLSQGGIRSTGRPLDLALRGKGFFAVETPAGRRYTRKGRMYLNADGELVDAGGHPFVSDRGALSVPPDAKQVTVTRGGDVLADGQELGTLQVVTIPEPEKLVRESWCLLRNDGQQAEEATDCTVTQGALEKSNVNPLSEVVGLMDTVRAYEGNARVMRRMDSAKKQLIQTTN